MDVLGTGGAPGRARAPRAQGRPPARERERGSCRARCVARALSGWHAGHPKRSCRSEEHTSELQSLTNLVCRLLLEKKKKYGMECDISPPNVNAQKLTP